MHEVMSGYVERGDLPGLVALVARRGEVHVDAIGAKAVGAGEPMERDTIFRVASVTKPVTAVGAMILVEECGLRLDDPVDGLLPELADRRVLKRVDGPVDDTVPAQRPISVRDLLTFRMGFGHLWAPPGTYPVQAAIAEQIGAPGPPRPLEAPAPDEWLRRFARLPLLRQPGESWHYHTPSDVLGVLISRSTGQPLEAFLRERIFEPLGMADTAFSVPAEKVGRLATSYTVDPETGSLELFDEPGGQWSRPPAFPSGGGGLVSTVDDLLAFARMMLARGASDDGRRLLSRPSVELMTADQLTPEQKAATLWVPGYFDDHGWGFGMGIVTRRHDHRSVGTFGWDGGLGTSWYCDPSEGLAGILMTQRAWTSPVPPPVTRDFWTLAYQAIDE
jgi:CubicO group peptidase (beta-lactamase class C family)